MSDELIDVIDFQNQIVFQKMKSEVHEKGLPHRVAAVMLQRADEKYLVPTASDIKVEAGGLFHSAAGHIPSGETYLQGAKRELWEECGVNAEDFEFMGTFWFEREYDSRIEKERFEVYRALYTESMGQIKLNEEQVNEKWLSKEELKEIFRNTPEKISKPLQYTCREIFKF